MDILPRSPAHLKLIKIINIRHPTDRCILWPWGKDWKGYGRLSSPYRGKWKSFGVHRLAYEEFVGPLFPGKLVLHSCDNPPCFNPKHLRLGTHSDNIRDCISRGRWGTGRIRQGERHGKATITADDVREIRRSFAAGEITIAALGRKHGMTDGGIAHIIHRRNWRHI